VKYVLDTNVLSALMRGDAEPIARMREVRRTEVAVPQPVLAELAYGIERLPRSRRKDHLRARLALLRDELARAPWTDAVTDAFGAIKAHLEQRGRRLEDFDVAIAAHAVAHECVLVTADGEHMRRIAGLTVEDWSQR
jgi:tRNA(fMet)-specific endonuclease VapC